MSEQLIIRLGSHAGQSISWLVWASHSAEVIASGDIANAQELGQLAERLGSRPTIALVPASDVVLKQISLPTRPTRQILQALPYMLEDEQAEDIDLLWLALGGLELQEGQYLQQVAVVQRERMDNWLSWLRDAGFNVVRMLPDALLLPANALPACIELNQQWLVKQGAWQATAIDSSWWPQYLALTAMPNIASYSPWPADIMQSQQSMEPELPLALLARQLPEVSFTLLQGPYAPKRQQNKYWQQWRSSAALAASCVLAYLLLQGVSVWQLERQLKQVQQHSMAEYQQAFPGETIVNLSRQVSQKLASVGGGGEAANFLSLLAVLQRQLAEVGDINVDSLRFDAARTELRFSANAGGFQSFERLKTALEKAGYIVEQGALSNDGARVQGTVVMRSRT
ncbi:general secretion pathway protein GspL [Arsukibacterium ikkense]|uniref:Type II secretion system protein L n=1 Tax=Arsukibacterium ikkense TaxID=336831 RepID=A0A0M2V1A0_9GAMM|nr:type II secretion system protein GspL [Arsukibacterium ikkense]KKO44602.1 general secretion pathway protein GspL [Arsukibacterium ikkense]